MPDTAHGRLQAEIVRTLYARGVPRYDIQGPVVPTLQPGRPNKFLPRHQPRWVAACPDCSGAEVVPDDGPFVCGSCGATAPVDRSVMEGDV